MPQLSACTGTSLLQLWDGGGGKGKAIREEEVGLVKPLEGIKQRAGSRVGNSPLMQSKHSPALSGFVLLKVSSSSSTGEVSSV